MPQTLLSLNYDVLSNILPLISSHDASQLALTSHHAYALALPRFLSDISLGGLYYSSSSSAVSQLKAFCNFVLAPAPCWHGAPSARLDALRTLEIMRDAVRVRKDGIRTVDASAVALLSTVLQRAQGLQKVTLWGSDALFSAYPEFAVNNSASVHTLILGGDIAPLPALAHAFPRIRALEFVPGGGSCVPDWAYSSPDANPEALGPWSQSLECVDTGFPIVPLACPVRRVDLRNPIIPDMDSLLTAREFLGGTRPVVLSAAVSAYSAAEDIGVALGTAAPSLRYLDLVGDRCESLKDGYDWIHTSVTQGLSLLSNISLLGLSLSVTATATPASVAWKPQGASAIVPPSPSPAPPEQPIDQALLARLVAENAPSLQFVAINLTAAKDAANTERVWYRVREVARGTGRRVEKMSEDEGRATATRMTAFNRYD